jgi:hypothetical protein
VGSEGLWSGDKILRKALEITLRLNRKLSRPFDDFRLHFAPFLRLYRPPSRLCPRHDASGKGLVRMMTGNDDDS